MITITGTPKEIAALAGELLERRKESRGPDYKGALTLEKVTSARIAACGPTADKLGDPAASGNKIEQYLLSKDQTSADQGSDSGERQAP